MEPINADLEDDYAAAWDEWEASGEEAAWASAVGDGVSAEMGWSG